MLVEEGVTVGEGAEEVADGGGLPGLGWGGEQDAAAGGPESVDAVRDLGVRGRQEGVEAQEGREGDDVGVLFGDECSGCVADADASRFAGDVLLEGGGGVGGGPRAAAVGGVGVWGGGLLLECRGDGVLAEVAHVVAGGGGHGPPGQGQGCGCGGAGSAVDGVEQVEGCGAFVAAVVQVREDAAAGEALSAAGGEPCEFGVDDEHVRVRGEGVRGARVVWSVWAGPALVDAR